MTITLNEAVDIVNESLATQGYDFQIDKTSDDTIEAGLKKVDSYPQTQRNAIMEQMNLIVQQRNFGVMFNAEKNKFRRFLIDLTEEGFGVEDIFHELSDGIDPLWDDKSPEATQRILEDLVSYDNNKVVKAFHTKSFSRSFKATVDKRNYQKVFTKRGITRYIDTKLANLQWSAEVWLMNQIIGIVQGMVSDGKIIFNSGHNINNNSGLSNFVESVKATAQGFLTPSNLFNYGAPEFDTEDKIVNYRKVTNLTDESDDIFYIVTPEVMERAKVQGYSNAFNLSQFEIEGKIIYVPSGTDLGTIEIDGKTERVLMVVLDRRAILVGIKHWLASSKFIENVFRTNHWLNIEGIKGYNTFFNAVAFTGEGIDDFFADNSAVTVAIAEEAYSYSTIKLNGVEIYPEFEQNDATQYTRIALVKCHKGDVITVGFDTYNLDAKTTVEVEGSNMYDGHAFDEWTEMPIPIMGDTVIKLQPYNQG